MKKIQKMLVIGILITTALLLTGCGVFEFDAAGYVEACVDLIAKGDTDSYKDMLKISEERAEETYKNHINNLVDFFVRDELSDSLMEQYRQFCKDFYAKSKYEVKGAEKMRNGEGYEVMIETQRMNGIYQNLGSEAMLEVDLWVSRQTEKFSNKEYFEAAYGILLDILYERLDNISYDEPETIIIQVMEDNNRYSLANDAYMIINDALIYKGED